MSCNDFIISDAGEEDQLGRNPADRRWLRSGRRHEKVTKKTVLRGAIGAQRAGCNFGPTEIIVCRVLVSVRLIITVGQHIENITKAFISSRNSTFESV